MANTPIIQNSVPVKYDPRVVVNPSAPDRVPHLPAQILYLIAKALPQPKSVLSLALANKETWEYLQPALFESEVTYEARLAQRYGGGSSSSLQQHYGKRLESDSEDDHSENHENDVSETDDSDQYPEAMEAVCQHGRTIGQCDECEERINLDDRTFESPLPDNLLFTDRRMTALHWACMQGASALPVALKALCAAQKHQPSYINGVGLQERKYRDETREDGKLVPADLPPPIFLAAAHGNVAVCKALIDAGCDLDIVQGQAKCEDWGDDESDVENEDEAIGEPVISYKIHKACVASEFLGLDCVCQWGRSGVITSVNGCQSVGHVAIQYGKIDILKTLLRSGLNTQLGLVPLMQYAVVEGNFAAAQALLDHDASLIHSRFCGQTLMHFVPFMKQKEGRSLRHGRVQGMIEYLLERGVELDGRSDFEENATFSTSEMTALQSTLGYVYSVNTLSVPEVIPALYAAEVLINMGADWNQTLSRSTNDILDMSIVRSVLLLENMAIFPPAGQDHDEKARAEYREFRKAWGRVGWPWIFRVGRYLGMEF